MMNLQPGYYITSKINGAETIYEGICWPDGETRTTPYATFYEAVIAKERIETRREVPSGRILKILRVEEVEVPRGGGGAF